MKAAIATPDGNILWKDHFGQSPFYQICEFDGDRWVKNELRKNTIAEKGEHARPQEIRQMLEECSVFAARDMGKKSRKVLESTGIITFLEDVETVREMIALLPKPDIFSI